jgi:hypothetical protein
VGGRFGDRRRPAPVLPDAIGKLLPRFYPSLVPVSAEPQYSWNASFGKKAHFHDMTLATFAQFQNCRRKRIFDLHGGVRIGNSPGLRGCSK